MEKSIKKKHRFLTLKRIFAISRKEFLHIIHDFRSLMIIFAMPVLQLVMFGYALNMEIQIVDLAVIDHSDSPISRDLIRQFESNTYFSVQYYNGPMSKIDELFLNREARVILIIDKDFQNPVNGQKRLGNYHSSVG